MKPPKPPADQVLQGAAAAPPHVQVALQCQDWWLRVTQAGGAGLQVPPEGRNAVLAAWKVLERYLSETS